MKLAVIDCGTNTFNLIVADVAHGGRYRKVFHSRVPVKLGEGTINGGFIDDRPFARGIEALRGFHEVIVRERVDRVLAYATSAIRDGRNGPTFVDTVRQLFGFRLEVIDGGREADLVYLAVREAVPMNGEISLIMDIGGGSTEFILASRERIFWKNSFLLGAARLLERFRPGDPIMEEEKKNLRAFLGEQLRPLLEACRELKPGELIGSSGAFESFVEMIHTELGGEPFDPEKTAYEIDLARYRHIADRVIASTMHQRKQIRGLVPMRYDMIVICCLMVDHVLESLGLRRMRMSTWSLKEGAMVEFVKQSAE